MPSCPICSIEASSDKLLRMHIQAKHDERVLKCEKCEATCKGGRKLKTHMDSHREVNCKHCDKRIPYNSRNSHTNSHKTLQSEFYLEKHISSTHRVQMNLVKTAEGHIGFFPSNELQNDLHCTHCIGNKLFKT